MRRLIAVAATAAALAGTLGITAPAHAVNGNGCTGGAYSVAGQPIVPARGVVTIGTGAGGTPIFYVDDRNYLNSSTGNGLWIYQESNKIGGLQTKLGSTAVTSKALEPALGPDTEICNNGYTGIPDTLIF